VLGADIRGFFDTIDHEWMQKSLHLSSGAECWGFMGIYGGAELGLGVPERVRWEGRRFRGFRDWWRNVRHPLDGGLAVE
jgi:hypothetical protein